MTSPSPDNAAALRTPSTAFADPDAAPATTALAATPTRELLAYLALGTFLGIVFIKSEVVSWYRIQEMFRFQSFHMYGVIGAALITAAASLWILRRLGVRTLAGDPIAVPDKAWTPRGWRYSLGGLTFGLGWALLGACPGPIFALIGAGNGVFLVALAAAVGGTAAYGLVRDRLPH